MQRFVIRLVVEMSHNIGTVSERNEQLFEARKALTDSETAALNRIVNLFRNAKRSAQEAVERAFPIGARVRVQLEYMPVEGIVHCYVADSPDRLGILFENGNVWDKPIESVTVIG